MLFVQDILGTIIDDWIQTADLWYQNHPLYQLRHNQTIFYRIADLTGVRTRIVEVEDVDADR